MFLFSQDGGHGGQACIESSKQCNGESEYGRLGSELWEAPWAGAWVWTGRDYEEPERL